MNLFELFVKIGADTSQAEKGMKSTQGVSETLTNKIKVMSAQFEAAQKNVDKLTQEFNESVNKAGATDKATQELAKKLADAEKEAGQFAKKLDEVQKEAEQSEKSLDDCNEEIKDTGEKAEKSGKGLSNFASKLGKGLATAAKIGTAAVGAAVAGITALTGAAVKNYAEYEQLVGGVDTLFKKSSSKVQEYAANAFRTAGLSSNEYMATVTSFSASLLQSLGGDTDKASEYADQAIRDMSDNANKMGTDMSMIQNAYQGFAKQNYSMLDNLKLGYGGTASEMYRLLKRAAELDKTFAKTADFSIDSKGHLTAEFADITQAIHIVQSEMGITGTTADEAGRTISGSVGSMKAAWTNLVTGFADGSADIGGLIDNLVTTIVGDGTESNLGVIGNVLPAIETALGGIVQLIAGAAPKIIEIFPSLVEQVVPSLVTAATDMVNAVIAVVPDLLKTVVDALVKEAPELIKAAVELVKSLVTGIKDNYQILIDGAITIVEELVKGVVALLPEIIKLGLDLIVSLANGIAENIDTLIPTIIDVVSKIVDILTNQETLIKLLNAAFTIVSKLAWGLVQNIDKIINAVFTLLDGMIDFLLRPANLAMLIETAIELVLAIGVGIVRAIPQLLVSVASLIGSIFTNFFNADWDSIGKNLVDGFKNGISNAWTSLETWFRNLFGDLIGIAKKILGIASPSKVFKKLGSFTADGFGIGFEDEFAHVKDDMEDAMNFDDASVGINASIRKVGAGAAGGAFGGTSIGNISINIDGAQYSDEQSLASAIAQEIQNMTDRRAAVYA